MVELAWCPVVRALVASDRDFCDETWSKWYHSNQQKTVVRIVCLYSFLVVV